MNRGRRQRTKTFTGCWTCRARRVKCDEQAPTCRRCDQSGVTCEGYGLRLSWVTSTDSEQFGIDAASSPQVKRSRRAPGSAGTSLAPLLSSDEVDAMLDRVDQCRPGGAVREKGGFSVFSSVFPENKTNHNEKQISTTPETHTSTPAASRSAAPAQPDITAPMPRHLDLLIMPGEQKRLIHHWVTFTSSKLVLLDEADNPCRTLMLPMALRGLMSPAADTEMTLSLSPPTTTTTNTTTPTADIATFHAICACAAYNLYNLSSLSSSSSPSHSIQAEADRVLALRHDASAIRHLRHNLSLADSHTDQSFAMAIMACITIEAVSGRSGGRWRAHVEGGLAYLARLVRVLRDRGEEDVSAAFRSHMVSMAILCGCEVDAGLKAFLWEGDAAGGGGGGGGGRSLELNFPYYGASGSFLRCQDSMNGMAAAAATERRRRGRRRRRRRHDDDDDDDDANTNNVNAHHQPTPPEFSSGAEEGTPVVAPPGDADDDDDDNTGSQQPHDPATKNHHLDAFELQLYLDFPATVNPQGGAPKYAHLPRRHAAMLHHMAQAFYYAKLVYFQRLVRGSPLASVQALVARGVGQLEAIEEVGQGEAGSVMMWPALILGAECGYAAVVDGGGGGGGGGREGGKDGLQGRMARWFAGKQRLGFRNVVVIREMCECLWEKRRRARRGGMPIEAHGEREEDVTWQDMVLEERFDVFRL